MLIDLKSFISRKLRTLSYLDVLTWTLIVGGILIYVSQFLLNRSLWHDEAKIAINVIKYSAVDFLHQPLPYAKQAAPFGFLSVEKFATLMWGNSEHVLRLFPLLCGLVSLWLFTLMSRVYLQREFAIFALLSFLITPAVIYYSSEVKQYGPDILAVLVAYVVFARACAGQQTWARVAFMGLFGALLVWFSFPIVFILAGIGVTLLVDALLKKDWIWFKQLIVISLCWLVSFAIYYLVSLQNIVHVKGPEGYWNSGFLSFTDVRTWGAVFGDLLNNPMGFNDSLWMKILSSWHWPVVLAKVSWLAGALFFLGGVAFFWEDKRKFFLLTTPLMFVFLACGFQQYSCKTRLALFLVPVFWILIIRGVQMIASFASHLKLLAALILTAILLVTAIGDGLAPRLHFDEMRPVWEAVQERWQQGDVLSLYSYARPMVDYYAFLFGFIEPRKIFSIKGHGDQVAIKKDLDKLREFPRVWLVFAHVKSHNGKNDQEFSLNYLKLSGAKMLDKVEAKGAAAFLVSF